MKLNDLREQVDLKGVVIGIENDQFHDIYFVDYDTHNVLDNQRYRGFIEEIRETDGWDELLPFFMQLREPEMLGEEFSMEDELYLFGPFKDREMQMLDDYFNQYLEKKYGPKGGW